MTPSCNVCGTPFGEPLYTAAEEHRITSDCKVLTAAGRTTVHGCRACGHLLTPPLPNLQAFYEQDYCMVINSDDEDQLYQVVNGVKTYRYDHQLTTLLDRVKLPPGALVLDYGCAKGAMLKRLQAARPDVAGYLYDVSDLYKPFWERFTTADRWAVRELPAAWRGTFDLVMSFYVFEHLERPLDSAREAWDMLRPGGTLYLIVPNVYAHRGDFIVTDHVNHFSPTSLRALLAAAGYTDIEIDDTGHAAAFIARAVKADAPVAYSPPLTEVGKSLAEAAATGRYWSAFGERVRELEAAAGDKRVAVYGSGFYGTVLTCCLRHPERVACYLDQNPHRWEQTLLGKPVAPPERLPADVSNVYVALNPAVARQQQLERLPGWAGRAVTLLYP